METEVKQSVLNDTYVERLLELIEAQRKTEQLLRETIQMQKATDNKWDKLSIQLGGIANNQEDFAEEYFFNSFENGKTYFFGEKFDDIEKNLKNSWRGIKDEYDIVLYNHDSVAIIEVKYKAHKNDIQKILKKAETFRILFPQYQDYKIYLGLASLSFNKDLEDECRNEGIAIIKQVGDSVIIKDNFLKVF